MLRLAVSAANETLCREIAPRLRGVMLETFSEDALRTCDAAVFFNQPDRDGLEIERVLQAGKPVLVAAEVWWASAGLQGLADVQLTVANLDRYLPSRQLIRQQLDAGKLGEPGLIRVYRWEPAVTAISLLRDLDLVLWYFGKSPNLIYAVEQAGVLVHLGFPGGGMALLHHTHQLPASDGYYALSMIGSCGAAHADDHQNMHLLYRRGQVAAIRADEGILHFVALVQEFVDALRTGRDLSAHRTGCRNALCVAAAVRQSLQTRQAIEPEGLQ